MSDPQYYYYTNSKYVRRDILTGLLALAVPVTLTTMRANCLDFVDWITLSTYDLGKQKHLTTLDRDPNVRMFRSLLRGERVYCLGWNSTVYIWRRK